MGIEGDSEAFPHDKGDKVVNQRAYLHQSTSIEKERNVCDQLK